MGEQDQPGPDESDRRQRLLLVEDEETLRVVLAEVLAEAGYEVEAYGNGAEALAAIQAGDYDLYVLDLVLPDITGEELCLALAAQGKPVAECVVMMTGYVDCGHCEAAAGVRCVRKPFLHTELLELLRGLEAQNQRRA
jgi:CheY-like chemotaxis protein